MVRFLRLCPCATEKFPSRTFKEFNNFYSASWSSLKVVKTRKEINGLCFINPYASYSTQTSQSTPQSRYVRHLDRKIALLKTVGKHLELLESVGKFVYTADRVVILFRIAKIAEEDVKEKHVLEKEREKSQQGEYSVYIDSLERISKSISKCNSWHLANLMWALGKIQEKDHKLVEVSEKEILLRGIANFNNGEICQIVNGCKNLDLITSVIFPKLEEAILNGEVNICDVENRELSGILASFSKTDNGTAKLFYAFLDEILSRDFSGISSRALAEFVWSFAKKEFVADELFDRVEEEILRRGTLDLDNAAFTKILWAFAKAEKGSKRFFYHLDHELVSNGLKRFDNGVLLEIVWSFTKRNATKANVFDLVEDEVFNRGAYMFEIHELVLILFSFVSAQRHDDLLVAEIESELCLRDVKQFTKGDLCQVAWSLGRAGKSDSNLFDIIEAQVLERGTHELPAEESHLLMLMRGFIEAKRGTKRLFEFLTRSFSETGFRNLRESGICECVWCFSNAGIEAKPLFDSLEKEILNQDKYFFSDKQIAFIKESFRQVGKGSSALFEL